MLKSCLMMLVCVTLLVPTLAVNFDDEALTPVEPFDNTGFTGAWVQVPTLEMEFFLPEGWTAVEPDGDIPFAAANADHTASLNVEAYDGDYGGEPLSKWIKTQDVRDGAYTLEMANGQEVAVIRADATHCLTVVVPCEGTLVRFNFERDSEEALSDALALAIAGTVQYYWD